jgi:hypothetical protein
MVNRFLVAICCLIPAALFGQSGTGSTGPAPSTAAPAAAAAANVPEGGMPKYIKEETPEQRMVRLGTQQDPGIDPDPEKIWWRFAGEYQIHKYERRLSSTDGVAPGWIRPFGFANIHAEIYQMNDKYVWYWWPMAKLQRDEYPAEPPTWTAEQIDYIVALQPEYAELTPADSGQTVRFVESSQGLPTSGSWRNVLDVADANGDGFVDIIAPPERKGAGTPAIFLGDGRGNWKEWQTRWPYGVDYGSIAAADFNNDGHMDVVCGIHLVGVRVFLGDGKGTFIDASAGLPSDYPTRRVTVADVDRDGDTDIIAIHEGPTARGQVTPMGRLVAFLNTDKAKKWQAVDIADPAKEFGGDYLAVGNFNGDRYPDMVGASVYLNGTDIVYFSDGKNSWKNVGGMGQLIPYFSYYYGMTPGKFASKQRDDVAVSFVRQWPAIDKRFVPAPKNTVVAGIDLVTFEGKVPQRKPIVRWRSELPVRAVASGDFNGDGHLDVIYTADQPRKVEILLGNGRGEFKSATVEGLSLTNFYNYDVKVADVNRDKLPDVILMYEADDAKNTLAARDGSIQVFLGLQPPRRTVEKKAASK